jgi:LCP family protein required for cell wall assembly
MKKINLTVNRIRHNSSLPHDEDVKFDKGMIDNKIDPEYFIEIPQAKKNKPKSTKKPFLKSKLFKILIVLVVFGGLLYLAYLRIMAYGVRVETYDAQGNKVNKCENILNPECWTEAFRPQLKQTDGYTTALVLGLDTRDDGSLMNTDSIMLIIYNHATKKSMLLSIPRDFYSFVFKTKISAVYAFTHNRDKSDPFRYIKEEVTRITGRSINYVVTVKLNGVTQLVDKLGGIEICPTVTFTAKYPNPKGGLKGEPQWLYYDFVKGCQVVNGERALVYARFRHIRSGPQYLASDFSRGPRQQEVVNGVKKKIMGDNLSLKERSETYWTLLQEMNKYINVEVSLEDFLAALSLFEGMDKVPANVMLDPNFGGLYKFMTEQTRDGEGYTVKAKDTSFGLLKAQIALVWKNIDFYKESPNIMVRNQTGAKTLPATSAALKIKSDNMFWSKFNVINDAKTDKFYGVKIFDFTAGAKPNSLAIIKAALGVSEVETLPETYGIARSKENEDFLIVVGPDQPAPTTEPTTAQ